MENLVEAPAQVQCTSALLGRRLKAGHQILILSIVVRIHAPEPTDEMRQTKIWSNNSMIGTSYASARLVSVLVRLGRLGSDAMSAADGHLLRKHATPCPAAEFWTQPMDSMSKEDKVLYFKGALLAERDFDWGCGSVAAVIWIHARLRKESIPGPKDETRELAEWTQSNLSDRSFFRPYW